MARLTPRDLIAFEDEMAQLFLDKRIKAPLHLAGGNEDQLIQIFEQHVKPQDWICCSWRSHYHALLKGVPPEQLKQAILDGKSISLSFPDHRILSSAIVGGTAPIAVGLAMGIKKRNDDAIAGGYCGDWLADEKVICFIGDMTAESGIVHESMKYACAHELPLLWVIEDNGKSVCTDTREVWGFDNSMWYAERQGKRLYPRVVRYSYEMTRPHVGVGQFVNF